MELVYEWLLRGEVKKAMTTDEVVEAAAVERAVKVGIVRNSCLNNCTLITPCIRHESVLEGKEINSHDCAWLSQPG
jgi:hypothetical protein